MSPKPPTAAALAHEVVLRALGGEPRAGSMERLEAALARAVTRASQLEASVRWSPGAFRGGRLMVEAIPLEAALALAAAAGVDLPPLALRLAELAGIEGLPLIGGFDVSPGAALVKLYLNASDAAAPVRRRLRERAGIASSAPALDAPHVIGVNARRDARIDLKLYRQDEDGMRLAAEIDDADPALRRALLDRAHPLAERAAREQAAAGAVVSWDVTTDGAASPRAFFVAIRAGGDAVAARLAGSLPGWSAEAVAAELPFSPGPVRSIGVSLRGPLAHTVYFKPRGSTPLSAGLDPAARFRAGPSEVGIFLEPVGLAGRAYARTARYAISYRCREGSPPRPAVETLMLWVTSCVRAAEESGRLPAHLLTGAGSSGPPSPWHVVLD